MKRAFSMLVLAVLAGLGVAQAQAATADVPDDGGECGSSNPSSRNNCRTGIAVTGVRG